jgi:hypothetical protein
MTKHSASHLPEAISGMDRGNEEEEITELAGVSQILNI